MARNRNLSHGHQSIVDRSQTMGFLACNSGMCVGLSISNVWAALAQELGRFDETVAVTCETPLALFSEEIKKLTLETQDLAAESESEVLAALNIESKKIAMDDLILGEEQKTHLLDASAARVSEKIKDQKRSDLTIPSFMKKTNLLQLSANKAWELKKKILNPRELVTSCVMPLTLEREGGISCIHFSGDYTETTLALYFKNLRYEFEKGTPIEFPVAFLLHDSKHLITISYHPTHKTWTFFDANQMPTQYHLTDKEVAQLVSKAFSENGIAVFTTDICTTKAHSVEMNKRIAALELNPQWIAIHAVYPAKAEYVSSKGVTRLYLAAKDGDYPLVQELLKNGYNPLQMCTSNGTSYDIALAAGHQSVADLLMTAISSIVATPYTLEEPAPSVSPDVSKQIAEAQMMISMIAQGRTLFSAPTDENKQEVFITNSGLAKLLSEHKRFF